MEQRLAYVPSSYFGLSRDKDGSLILVNALTGAIGTLPPEEADRARAALRRSSRTLGPLTGVLEDLRLGGFLIPEGTDERATRERAYLSKYDPGTLSLTVLPTEQCNFRCVYCYESFQRGTMTPELREGIRRYVAAQGLRRFHLNWFGGEPLLAAEVVIELVQHFSRYCAEQGIAFVSSMTTNGSLLTREIAAAIVPAGVRYFQITLDGSPEDHDRTRVAASGGPTFGVILANLRALKAMDEQYVVAIRHNFSPANLPRIEQFIALLKSEFGGDARFTTMFQPVGKWGGAKDADLVTCSALEAARAMLAAKRLAVEAGFRTSNQFEAFQPHGYACYAADPRSFVIGSDGTVYKCTVELDYHDRNKVGRLHPDGTLDLDWRKVALWVETNGLRAGAKCQSCWFSPACFGAVCPKAWMERGDVTCPPEKLLVHETLPLLVEQAKLPAPPPVGAAFEGTRD